MAREAEGVERVPDEYAPGPEEALNEACRLLAEEHPFHAHEVLEARWKTGPAEERDLWQGLAQICVGLTHVQRGNTTGAAALLTRGADTIAGYGPRKPYGVDLDEMARVARLLAGTGPDPSSAIALVRRTITGD
jgi:predicted metal-dependent hydrolase